MKTLLTTSVYFKENNFDNFNRWYKAIKQGKLNFDKILICDDASEHLPIDIPIINELNIDDPEPDNNVIFNRFNTHLGRPSLYDHKGWYRSITFMGQYACRYNYDKIIYIEPDAFIISDRLFDYFNFSVNEKWESLWCPRHSNPETAIQIIQGKEWINKLAEFYHIPLETFGGKPPDPSIYHCQPFFPYSINRNFIGDRYGEYTKEIPQNADYACQLSSDDGIWWIKNDSFN